MGSQSDSRTLSVAGSWRAERAPGSVVFRVGASAVPGLRGPCSRARLQWPLEHCGCCAAEPSVRCVLSLGGNESVELQCWDNILASNIICE